MIELRNKLLNILEKKIEHSGTQACIKQLAVMLWVLEAY
jgi:hypothetical protein